MGEQPFPDRAALNPDFLSMLRSLDWFGAEGCRVNSSVLSPQADAENTCSFTVLQKSQEIDFTVKWGADESFRG